MSDLVTGDAVVVELRLARLASRAVAFGIDLAVMLTAFLALLSVAGLSGSLGVVDGALAAAIGLVVVLLIFVGYPVTVETLTRGRSLGKIALGLRVVREDGGPIRFRQAFARGLAGFVLDFGVFSAFTGAVALITSLVSARGRRVGDMLAGTVVVRERVPQARTVDIGMPPPLAQWATALSLSQLPDPLAAAGRQFLQRAADLDPAVRGALGPDLANRFAAVVGPAAPPGTPPEAYLAAVLAERRRREQARLGAQRPRADAGGGVGPFLPVHPGRPGPVPRPGWGPAATPGPATPGPATPGSATPGASSASRSGDRGAAPAPEGFAPPR